jgi:flagellar basal-body rod protein FlgF
VAILGDGFFQVKKGDDIFLTRAGNFQVTPRGELVTSQGYSVLGETGQPVTLNPDDHTCDFDDLGQIHQKDGLFKLAIVKPESLDSLVKHGENLFRPTGETPAIPEDSRRTAAGFLEASSVNPTLEMTSMIEASRVFEANINMLKTQDQMLGSLISQVLRI